MIAAVWLWVILRLILLPSAPGSSETAEAEILRATLDLLFNYCFPASSSLLLFLPLSHTLIVWALFSPPSVSLTSSLSLFLPLCPTAPLSLTFSWTGKSPERGSSLDALPVRTLITCGSWHSNHISYALSLSFSESLTHTHQLTHRHAPQQQMGIPAPGRLCSPHQERADQKLQPVLRGQGYKTVSRFSLFKNNWPLWPSSSHIFSHRNRRGGLCRWDGRGGGCVENMRS